MSLAAWLIRHALRTLPRTQPEWADAIRNEFEHIKGQPGALAWAWGCVIASYTTRLRELRHRPVNRPVHRPVRLTVGRMVGRMAACGVAALLVGYAIDGQASDQAPPPPAFTDTACDLPRITPALEPRVRCGTVSVPRDYSHPGAGSYRLAVVVIRSARQPALPDSLLYISGGPGSPLTVYAAAQAAHPFAAGRDLILVDQRGSGRSEPAICPNHVKDLGAAFAAVALSPDAATREARRAAWMACRDEAVSHGIDLRDFGTDVTVRDFEVVRRALGVPRWNVFSVSYGTTVAMTLMARHPDTLRSVVLDSVNPPDPVLPPWSLNVAAAREAFFAACDSTAACAAAYPDLAGMYRETLHRLDQSPLPLRLPPDIADPSHPVRLTSPVFKLVVGHLIYYPIYYPGLPRLIASVHAGDATNFATTLVALLTELNNPETATNPAANAAVDCRDRPRFRQPLADTADIFDLTSFYGICAGWSELGASPVIPRNTPVPTLVLAGQFDPNATPVVSERVADMIGPRARWVEFALAGHSVRAFSPCAARMVAAFVDQPAGTVDVSCADHPPPIRFLPPHP